MATCDIGEQTFGGKKWRWKKSISSNLQGIVPCCGMLRTIESPLLAQEAHFALGVAPDKTHNHSRLLTALESVYAAELDAGVSLL